MAERRSRGRELALVVGGFTAVAIAFTFPLVIRLRAGLPGDLGDPSLNAWILAWVSDRLAHGGAGLWDAPIFFPHHSTLAYSENLLGIAVFVAPLYWLTRDAVLTYNVAFLGSYVLAGVGMYALVRELVGRRDAAWLAGLAFALSPYRAGQMMHLQMLTSGWMPLGLAALHRYSKTGSRRALAAFAALYVIQVLSNGYMLYFFALPVAVVAIAEGLGQGRLSRGRVAELAGAAGAIFVALAPVLLTYYRVRSEQGQVRTPTEIQTFSADVGSFLHSAAGIVTARWLPGFERAEGELFPGLVCCALGLAAFAHPWRRRSATADGDAANEAEARRAVVRYATIAGLAAVLALGPAPTAWGRSFLPTAPYAWLLHVVPGLDGLRAPARIGLIMILGLAVLAGIGASELARAAAPRFRVALLATLAIAIAAEGYPGPLEVKPLDDFEHAIGREAHLWLASAPPGAVIDLPFGDGSTEKLGHTLAYQWAQLLHGHPLVNGYSGYGSPLSRFLSGLGSPLRELDLTTDWLEMLRGLGVRYVVTVGRDEYRETLAHPSKRIAAVRASTSEVAAEQIVKRAHIFILKDPPLEPTLPAVRALPSSELEVTASASSERIPALVDGNLDTRWFTREPQRGTEWLRVALNRPRPISGLELGFASRSLGEFPRKLVIEIGDENGAVSEVYRGGVLAPLGLAIVETPSHPRVRLRWPTRSARVVMISQIGSARCCGWSLHELELLSEVHE